MPHRDSKHLEDAQAPAPVELHPPLWLRISRWFAFSATVAIAIGMLAMLDQHLTGLPFTYDGPRTEFQGMQVTIEYCMLSTSPNVLSPINCRFGFAAAAVGLAISLIWTYIQGLRRNPYKHRHARLADLVLCLLGLGWWIAVGIILCTWTNQANNNGVPRSDWRNGLCVLAWAEVLFFAYMAATSLLLATTRSQKMFDKWAEKDRLKKEQRHAAKQQKLQHDAEAADAAAAAARARTAQPTHGPVAGPTTGPAASSAVAPQKAEAPLDAPRAGPASAIEPPRAAPAPAGSQQSAWPSAGVARPAAGGGNAGDVNPFLTEGPERPMQPAVENV